MDVDGWSMPAAKLLVGELRAAAGGDEDGGVMRLGSLRFDRVWLQGVVVPPCGQRALLLDDGSGVIDLLLGGKDNERGTQAAWVPGMYVLVNGRYRVGSRPFVEVHKILDLSSEPDREAAWNLEVAEVHDRFYKDLMADSQREQSGGSLLYPRE